MRRAILLLPLAMAVAIPAAAQAQGNNPLENRVTTIERELRAVQRKVFPGGDPRFFEPEVQPTQAPVDAPGVPASSPVIDLSRRVDALEAQLATMTGQVEQNGYRLRQLEEKVAALGAPAGTALPGGTSGTSSVVAPPAPGANAPAAAPGDTIEAAYRAAYAQVDARNYAAAESQLKAFVQANPKHRRASHAQYWLGRSYYADGKLNLAAEAFLGNYQTNPRGERAPDSLLWLGRTLTDLKKPTEACRVLRELDEVYGAKMSSDVRDQTAKARAAAKCSA